MPELIIDSSGRTSELEKLGTTKVQLGADSADGADSGDLRNFSFPKKIKNP